MKVVHRLLFGVLSVVVVAAIALFVYWDSAADTNALTGYAAKGDVAGVESMLKRGVDPNTPSRWGWTHENEGQTPLTAAAQFGHLDVVRVLLQSGADPDLRDFGPDHPHDTPLSAAAMNGHLEICRALIAAGADPNIPTYPMSPGEGGNWTALDWALQGGQDAVADLLRQYGAVESGKRRGAIP